MHETQGGSLLGTDSIEAKTQVELMRILSEHTRKMVAGTFVPSR